MTKENRTTFTNREIRKALRLNSSNQKRYTLQLNTGQFIRKVKGTKAKGYEYVLSSKEEYQRLQMNVDNVLDEILQKLKQSNGSTVVHKSNEPPKKKKARQLSK
jgi:hypothetical protein